MAHNLRFVRLVFSKINHTNLRLRGVQWSSTGNENLPSFSASRNFCILKLIVLERSIFFEGFLKFYELYQKIPSDIGDFEFNPKNGLWEFPLDPRLSRNFWLKNCGSPKSQSFNFVQIFKFLSKTTLPNLGFYFNRNYRLCESLLHSGLRPLFLNKVLWFSEMSNFGFVAVFWTSLDKYPVKSDIIENALKL